MTVRVAMEWAAKRARYFERRRSGAYARKAHAKILELQAEVERWRP